jgi:hypothetical protein
VATTQSIGTTGRDYSTLQAWEDAVPATPTGGYIGECYNDSEFTAGVQIAGHTTSATDYVTLTAAAGQSFQDHASVRSNALFYDQTKGVAVTANPFGFPVVYIDDDYVTVSRLQMLRSSTSYSQGCFESADSYINAFLRDCIMAKTFSGAGAVATMRGTNIVNCLLYDTGATAGTGFTIGTSGSALALNNTVVRVGSAGGTGIGRGSYGTPILKNNAVFNWTNAFTGSSSNASSGYNGTDAASAPGSDNQTSLTFADCFESVTNDFRLKSGSNLIGTGNTDATNAPNDISGTARGSGTAGDIGAWEFGAAAAPPILVLTSLPRLIIRH